MIESRDAIVSVLDFTGVPGRVEGGLMWLSHTRAVRPVFSTAQYTYSAGACGACSAATSLSALTIECTRLEHARSLAATMLTGNDLGLRAAAMSCVDISESQAGAAPLRSRRECGGQGGEDERAEPIVRLRRSEWFLTAHPPVEHEHERAGHVLSEELGWHLAPSPHRAPP